MVAEVLPLVWPACNGDVCEISFAFESGPIRRILSRIGEPIEPPVVSPARGPPPEWTKLVKVHDDRDGDQNSPHEFPEIDIR